MVPKLVDVLQLRLYQSKDDQLRFGSTKGSAQRFVAPLEGGFLKSTNNSGTIEADLVQGGSDWLRFDSVEGLGHLDARLHFRDRKNRDRLFYVRFEGLVRLDEKIQLVFEWSDQAVTTKSSEHYNFVGPIVEVSRDEDKWMEKTVFIGHGHYVVERPESGPQRQAVEYEIYKLASE